MNTLASLVIAHSEHVAVTHVVGSTCIPEAVLSQQLVQGDVTVLDEELELEFASKLLVVLGKLALHDGMAMTILVLECWWSEAVWRC